MSLRSKFFCRRTKCAFYGYTYICIRSLACMPTRPTSVSQTQTIMADLQITYNKILSSLNDTYKAVRGFDDFWYNCLV